MANDVAHRFGPIDWIIFGGTLAISLGIGVFHAFFAKKRKDSSPSGDFFTGERRLHVFPVTISIVSSFMSAILVIGMPAEVYTAGTLYYTYLIGMIFAIFISAYLFVPLLYPLKLTSSMEYLEKRFNSKAAKQTGNLIMAVKKVIFLGIVCFAASTAVEAVSAFPTWATVLIMGCVSTTYTCLGGLKTLVLTNIFQSTILIAGLLSIIIQGTVKIGGLAELWRINKEWKRIEFFNGDLNPTTRHTSVALIISATIYWTSMFGVSQSSFQRYCAVKTLQQSKCTMSSCLHSLSTITWEDVVKHCMKTTDTQKQMWVIRSLVVVYGSVGVGLALLAQIFDGTVLQANVAFTGVASGPLLGMFLLGTFFSFTNWLGGVVGGIVGLCIPLWISIGAFNLPLRVHALDFPTDNCSNTNLGADLLVQSERDISDIQVIYSLSYLWYPPIGACTTVLVGVVVSLIYKAFKGFKEETYYDDDKLERTRKRGINSIYVIRP